MKTDKLLSQAGEIFEYGRIYIQNQKELIRLEVAEKMAKTTSLVVTSAVVALMGMLFLIFFSLCIGFWLASSWESYPLAFGVVTLFHGALGSFIYFFRTSLVTNPILTMVLETILDNDDEELENNGFSQN